MKKPKVEIYKLNGILNRDILLYSNSYYIVKEVKHMKNEIILFENQDVKLEVNMKDETVWLNTEQMAELFDRDYKTIRKHINNALEEELRG